MYTDKPFPNVNYFDYLQWLLTDNIGFVTD